LIKFDIEGLHKNFSWPDLIHSILVHCNSCFTWMSNQTIWNSSKTAHASKI